MEIPEVIKKSINIIPVSTVDEVLKHALTKTLKPVKWAEIDQASSKKDEVTIAIPADGPSLGVAPSGT